jgi:GT2 family glycosyltransferase
VKFDPTNLRPRSAAPTAAVVRGWGNTALTARCLESLRRHAGPEALRLIYVDNGSELEDFAALLRAFPDLEAVRQPVNRGSCRGINLGLALAAMERHDAVLLLDNDTEVPDRDAGWLERWRGALGPGVGAVGAVSDRVYGAQRQRRPLDPAGGAVREEAIVLVSFAVLLSRAALEAIGWLADERFEPGNSEDYDLCLRMREAGWRCLIARDVWIHHVGSATFRRFELPPLLERNMALLREKYGEARLRALGWPPPGHE